MFTEIPDRSSSCSMAEGKLVTLGRELGRSWLRLGTWL
jgi:hypothetical protein